jgi:AraC-like DNA-binding protein
MKSLAAHVGWTPSRLARRFKAAYGLTPAAFQRRLRLEKALRLLQGTSLTLQQIAEEVGYAGAFHLSAALKQAYGSPPQALRGQTGGGVHPVRRRE